MIVGLVGSLLRNAPGLGTLAAGAATARHTFRRVVSQGRLHNQLRGVLQGNNSDITRIDLQFANNKSKAWDQKQLVQSFLNNRLRIDRDAVGMTPLSPVAPNERNGVLGSVTLDDPREAGRQAMRLANRYGRAQQDTLVTWYHDVKHGNRTYRVFGHNKHARAVFQLDRDNNLSRLMMYRGISDHLGTDTPDKVFKTLDPLSVRNLYQRLRGGGHALTEEALVRLAQGGSFTTYGRRRTSELNEWLRPSRSRHFPKPSSPIPPWTSENHYRQGSQPS